ncbi:MAG TPA: hypothetical protein VI277_03315 [Candidatus Limnocylindria bacterium]
MINRNFVPGLLLIGLGSYLAIVRLTGVGAEAIVAMFGIGFLIAYALTRTYGFLIPGGIMTGLGLGIMWEMEIGSGGGSVVLGLGLGFLTIYVIDLAVNRSKALWWPLIPGGILTVIGGLVEADNVGLLVDTSLVWPIVLIGAGAVILLVQLGRRRDASQGTGSQGRAPDRAAQGTGSGQ